MRYAVAVALVAMSVACGDNLPPPAPPSILDRLGALPNVADATEQATSDPGYRYIVLHFTQPVDHADPAGQTFLQEVSLIYHDVTSPLVVHTSGYWDYYLDTEVELTQLLGGNQISIEHRYFGTSRPNPADWTKLTIEQMADDEHAIVSALHTVFTGPTISTGGSKGGMTAMFYRRFFPDDVAGSVPYVAPIMFGAPDTRFPAFITAIDPGACHQAIEDVAVEMLKNHRAALVALAQQEATAMAYTYSRVAVGPAVESAVEDLEWSFWQYSGITACGSVPALTASDAQLYAFLDDISPVYESDDDWVAKFEAFYYQSDLQLGFPDDGTTYLKPYYMYTNADFANALPTAQPTYDGGAAMTDIASWVKSAGDHLVLVYGQWDPWTGGAYDLTGASDALELVEAQGTHGSDLVGLTPADRDAAFAKLAAWTGVTPSAQDVVRVAPREPRVPSAIVRALRARLNSP